MTDEPEEDGVQMKIIVESGFFQDVIDGLDALVKEAKFHFLDELIRIWVIDASKSAGCYVDIRPSNWDAIQHYSVQDQGLTQGLDLGTLDDILGYADAGDLLQMEYGEAHKWRFNLTLPDVDVNIAGIDPESVRAEPDYPDLDLPAKFTIDGSKLKDAADLNELFSDHTTIRVEDHTVQFIAKGDTDDGTFELEEPGEVEFIEHPDEPVESMFSLAYMSDMAKVLKGYDSLQMEIGSEVPVMLDTDLYEMMLAPRIPKE